MSTLPVQFTTRTQVSMLWARVFLCFFFNQMFTQFNCSNCDSATFARLPLEQAIGDELRAALLQGCRLRQAVPLHWFSLQLILTAQLRCVEGQSGEEQPGIVVNVGLD